MLRHITLKYTINIHLTILDVTYHPNKHNWLEKTKKHYFKEKNQIQTKFEMQRREFWERQFTGFPCTFYRNLPLTI